MTRPSHLNPDVMRAPPEQGSVHGIAVTWRAQRVPAPKTAVALWSKGNWWSGRIERTAN